MTLPIQSGRNVLFNDGVIPFIKKSSLFMMASTEFGDRHLFERSLEQLQRRKASEDSLEDIADTVIEINPGIWPYHVKAMQLREELIELSTILDEREPKSALEIGTANGGTLYTWSRFLTSISDIISLDLPDGRFGGGYPKRKQSIYRQFSAETDMHFVRANSHSEETFNRVESLIEENLNGDSVDFLFIDGDHTYDGVKADFEMYSDLVAKNGIIALHDIVHHPDDEDVVNELRQSEDIDPRYLEWGTNHPSVNVREFWDEIKGEYSTKEVIAHEKQTWGGIGLIYL